MKVSGLLFGSMLLAGALPSASAQAEDAKAGDLAISLAWCRAVPIASDANCYVTIENKGAAADRLTGASADVADKIEVRQLNTVSGGLTDKAVAGGLPISAGDKVALAPGGYHLALLNTKAALKRGPSRPSISSSRRPARPPSASTCSPHHPRARPRRRPTPR